MSLKSNVKQLVIYTFFGVITTAVNWAVYIGLQKVGVSVTASNAVAWFAAISVAFITNKKYTFKNKARSLKELLEQIILFVFSRLLSGLFEIFLPTVLLYIGLTGTLFGVSGFWAKIITNVFVICLNYILSRTLVFPQKNIIKGIKNTLKSILRYGNIKSIKRDERKHSMLANYHTHTYRCNHASGRDRDFVTAAIREGLTDLGFADHVPYIYPEKNYYEGAKMRMEELGGYFTSILNLRKQYADKIRIHVGFETEYYESCFDKTFNELQKYPLDYLILGQHRIGDYASQLVFAPTESESDLTQYVDTVIKAISTGKFSYIAHPDAINFIGDDNAFYTQMKRLCVAAKEYDVPLEINMLGAATGRNYPCEHFFKIIAEVGNEVIIGCDAHSPAGIVNNAGYEKCMAILKKYGITPLPYLKFKKI
ncbi:MAG: histidinol-phosphatase HisJ family protein [Acutalibacteraceae bacterium]|nr:histidinol-phosphatase HisJ family protein [Acutalibacteraceae bacterium]